MRIATLPPLLATGFSAAINPVSGNISADKFAFLSTTVATHCLDMDISSLDSWASQHDGLITRAASGLSSSAWSRAVAARRFELVHPGVARLYGTARTARQRIHAAVLASGSDAMASHRSAAHLWSLIEEPNAVDITRTQRREGHLKGVTVHRPSDQAHLTHQLRCGIRCTNVVRTLLDLGAVAAEEVGGAVGAALTQGLTSLDELEMIRRSHAVQGRAGSAVLRAAIDGWTLDGKPADSVLEMAMVDLGDRYRLPPLEFHPIVEGYEIDFRVKGTSVLLECDGWTFHGLDRRTFEADRRRDAELLAAGWVVMRFTYRAVTQHPGATVDRIRQVIERRAGDPIP